MIALSSLAFQPAQQISVTGTDGSILYFQPDALVEVFQRGRQAVNRRYLHSIMHCLFSHLWTSKELDSEYWNLACDIADDLHLGKVGRERTIHRDAYSDLVFTGSGRSALPGIDGKKRIFRKNAASGKIPFFAFSPEIIT